MVNNILIPEGFELIKRVKCTIFVRTEYRELFQCFGEALLDGSLGGKDENLAFTGRGTCRVVTLKSPDNRVVIRRYRHGGLLGMLAGDLFWEQARPFNELAVSRKASKMGLQTTEVVAIIKHKVFFPFFKADLVTREIANSFDLISCLKDELPAMANIFKQKKDVIVEIASSVRKMHDIGIFHGDLHLKNIMLKMKKDGGFSIYVIDLDKSTMVNVLTIAKRVKNLYRLDRSVEKLKMQFVKSPDIYNRRFPVSKSDRVRFFKEYMRGCTNGDSWRNLIRKYSPDYLSHKLRWRITVRG